MLQFDMMQNKKQQDEGPVNGEQSSHYTTLFSKILTRWKIGPALKKWKKWTGKSKTRFYRIKQMYDTEVTYNKDLELIVTKIQTPLRAGNFINEEQNQIIFPSLMALINLSKQIQNELKSVIDTWDIKKSVIAPQLIRLSKFFIVYSDYFKNYLRSKQIIAALLTNQKVQQIEKALYPQNFENYLAKPTQRPLKYLILLRDYQKDVPTDHIDYANLTQAIKFYNQVSEKNNYAMFEQQKNEKLIDLQNNFGDIIDSQSRYFVTDFKAILIDQQYNFYLLSDLVIVAKKKQSKLELKTKIFLDKSSFVDRSEDGKYFLNKIFLCGKEKCIHFSFIQRQERERVYTILSETIKQIYKKQFNRKEVISRNSASNRMSFSNSISLGYQSRFSFFNLQSQIKNKLRITIVGHEKRKFSEDKEIVYYVIKFQMAYPKDIYQLSYIEYQQLLKLEKMIRDLYPKFQFTAITQRPHGLSYDEMKNDQIKTIQFRVIFAEQLLNLIFRSQTVMKRGDIIAHKLKISHPIWDILTDSASECKCNICLQGTIITSMKQYNSEKIQRIIAAQQEANATFCPNRSIHTQICVARLDPKELSKLQERLLWVNCEMGRINHTLIKRINAGSLLEVKIHFLSVQQNEFKVFFIHKDDCVKDALDIVCKSLNLTTTRDLALEINVNNQSYILDEDQILYDTLMKQEKEQEIGFFDKIKHTIAGKEDRSIKVYLRKLYVFDLISELVACKENNQRYSYIISEIIYRLKNQELIVSVKDFKLICAVYYTYLNLHELKMIRKDTFQRNMLRKVIPEKKWGKTDDKFFTEVFQIILKIKDAPQMHKKQELFKIIIQTVSQKPGWNPYLFDLYSLEPSSLNLPTNRVRIGADSQKLYVRAERNMVNQLQIKLNQLKYNVSSFLLVIYTDNREYRFIGRNVFALKKAIEFNKLYLKWFGKPE